MKKNTGYLLGVLVVFVLCYSAQASYLRVKDTGFTRLPVNARTLGMGGAFVAVANDYSACYYNPAGLVNLTTRQVGSMYTDLYGLGLLSHSFLSFAEPDTGMGSGGISWSHLSANLEPEQWVYDMWIYSYANYINKEGLPLNSWGINAKYIREDTPYENASGYSFDIGYLRKDEKVSLGICIQDVISRIDWETGRTEALPVNVVTGIACSLNKNALIALDIDSSLQNLLCGIRIGGEWKIKNRIFLRGGFFQKFQEGESLNFSAGVGFKANFNPTTTLSFDYAFTSSSQLSASHYLSFSFNF